MTEPGAALLAPATRGVRLQLGLRAALVAFLVLTIIALPPGGGAGAAIAIVGVYALAAAAFTGWAWPRRAAAAHWGWVALFADVAVLAVLTLVAGLDAHESWTSDVVVVGLFLLPVLAATQLRPAVCAAVAGPAIAVSFASSWATQAANEEPLASIALRTFLLAAIAVACVGLSWIQRARVATIGGLLGDRTRLLDDLVHLEDREHRQLSERLHDGALQYVLAARLDLDDVRGHAPADVLERIDHALTEAARMLRSTVTELHPELLERSGLASALRTLAVASARSDLPIDVDVAGWPDGLRTPLDRLLFGAARELVGNAIKHADADHLRLRLTRDGERARLVVADDGRGINADERRRRLDEGHIGLYSQALRIEAAGGKLCVVGAPTGTVATVDLPLARADREAAT